MSDFGSGAAWASFAEDKTASIELLSALASLFVILQLKPIGLGVADPTNKFDDPVLTAPDPAHAAQAAQPAQGLPRTSTAVVHVSSATLGVGAQLGANHFVFRMKRKPQSVFEFVSVGRHADNDIHVPDESLSRFHAFFKETPKRLVLVDAKSQNGTFLRNAPVAQQGQGESVVASGDAIRFGDVQGIVLDASGLLALIRRK